MRLTTKPFKFLLNQKILRPITTGSTNGKKCIVHSEKQTHPSADRNSQPIADALCAKIGKQTGTLLEIASGSGQHAGFLAPRLPGVIFQPSEYDKDHFRSISAYAADCQTENIRQPIAIDISEDVQDLPAESFDFMLNCNMMHISPWKCSVGLFRAAGRLLRPQGLLFTYGPYAQDGVLEPESNVSFDRSLKSRNPEWGVRDIAVLKETAKSNGIELQDIALLPSNNKFLTWKKVR